MRNSVLAMIILAALCVHGKLMTRYNDKYGHTYYVIQVKRAEADKTTQTMRPTPGHKPEVALCVTKK